MEQGQPKEIRFSWDFFCENTDFSNISLCWFGYFAARRTSAGNWGNYSTSVIMRNHRNRTVVNLLEQLTEVFKAQVMPWNKRQIKMSWRRGCRAGTQWRKRKRKFKPFLPLIIMGNVRSRVDKINKLEPLMRQQKYQEGNIFIKHDHRNNSNTSLLSFKTMGRQTDVELFLSTLSTDKVHLWHQVTLCAKLLLSY